MRFTLATLQGEEESKRKASEKGKMKEKRTLVSNSSGGMCACRSFPPLWVLFLYFNCSSVSQLPSEAWMKGEKVLSVSSREWKNGQKGVKRSAGREEQPREREREKEKRSARTFVKLKKLTKMQSSEE